MFDVFYIGNPPNLFPHERAVTSIEQAQQLSRTRYFWILNYLVDYTGWNWLWEPAPWQSSQRHAWASQWQKDSGTYLIPKLGYTDTNYHNDQILKRVDTDKYWKVPLGVDVTNFDFSWHPDPTDPPYIYQFGTQHQRTGGPQYCIPGATDIKFVDQIQAKSNRVATAIYEIDHMDGNVGQIANTTKCVRYFDNYFDTLKRIAKNADVEQHEFIWICSSVCDYSNFDFSWHPEQWQATMLHVFASNTEKFGDTFFMHVPTFVQRANQFELLEWYDCNFIGTPVPRRPMPVIHHNYDSQADAVRSLEFKGPLAIFTNTDYVQHNTVIVPLWREKTKTIVPLSMGATSTVVPKTAVPYIKTQLYDYPYIDKTHRALKDQPLDIVFISNGEPYAEFNYQHLVWAVQMEGLDCNHIHHSAGVNGRVAAYQTAARLSTTPWFFAVFAKLEVDHRFDWNWQPDRMQQAKHYIFHAGNPVNGLVYGHQAMIAYNKKLVLETVGDGLDFTLEQPHEVVPIISGTANYAESPWMAWRTAFREVLKLQHSLPDIENEYRLKAWLREDSGTIANGHWSHKGAQDAVEYYNEVGGDFEALKKSYEWEWLASYAFMRRSLTPDR